MPEAEKVKVNTSKTVPVADTTLDDIKAAAAKVGAPNTARVATQSQPIAYPAPGQDGPVEETLPYTLTFTWTEEV